MADIHLGSTLPKLELGLLLRIITCKWIPEAIFYGWIVLTAPGAQQKVTLVYDSTSVFNFLMCNIGIISMAYIDCLTIGPHFNFLVTVIFYLLAILFLQIELTLYDPKVSRTGTLVTCDQEFCTSMYDGQISGCRPELLCNYNVVYGDGSSTAGYFVKDTLQFNQVTGNFQTAPMNGSVIFGWVVSNSTVNLQNNKCLWVHVPVCLSSYSQTLILTLFHFCFKHYVLMSLYMCMHVWRTWRWFVKYNLALEN